MDIPDNDLLVAKPVLLAGTADTGRHAVVVEDHMRPLFAIVRTLITPTSVFAAETGLRAPIGGSAKRSEKETTDIDFGSDLMRLETGGSYIASRRDLIGETVRMSGGAGSPAPTPDAGVLS